MKNWLIFLLIVTNQILVHAQQNVLWKFETKGRIYSSPLVDGDMAYIGSGDHSFYAIDKISGEKAWGFETSGEVHSSPCMIDKMVCVGSADGNLYALDKENGELIWKFESDGEKMYGLWDYYLSSPRTENGVIFWGSGDGNLYAIDGSTGESKWKFQTDGIIHASPVVYDNSVFFGGFDGYFYRLSQENGQLEWKFKTVGAAYFPKGEIQRAALVKDDVVYFGSRDYNIYALDAKTGRGKWNMRQPQGWIIATPLEYKGNIYFGTSDAHLFYCLEKNNGEVVWQIPLNMRTYGTAIVDNDIVYFGTFDGKLVGVDYLTGEIKWQYQTDASKSNYNTVYDEKGEFAEGFKLYGEDFEASEAKIHALGSILSSPVVDEKVIYFGSSDGNLYAVELK